MKIKLDENKRITVMLEHFINVDDLAWAVVWQHFVESNPDKITRAKIYRWAIDNIVEGRLYKNHANSEAARNNMAQAMELVHEQYPEFRRCEKGP